MKTPSGILILFLFNQLILSAQIHYRAEGCVIFEPPSKTLHYTSIDRYAYKLLMEDSTVVENFYRKNGDSVSVHKNEKILGTYTLINYWLSGETFKLYDMSGTLRALDSFYLAEHGAKKKYFNAFNAQYLSLSKTFYPSGAVQSTLYYCSNGSDSLYREWYTNGILKYVKRFKKETASGFNHYPIIERKTTELLEYYPNGVVAKKEKSAKNYSAEYRETGTLKTVSFDTLINKQQIRCIRNYYANGKIQFMHYFQEGKPCYTWREYAKTGTLTSTIQKATPHKILTGPAIEQAPEIFMYVEQQSEYPGGQKALENYFEDKLATMRVTYPDLLSGKYALIIEISPSGKAVFKNVRGYESEMIKDYLAHVVTSMPPWHPAKRQGCPISESYEIILSAK